MALRLELEGISHQLSRGARALSEGANIQVHYALVRVGHSDKRRFLAETYSTRPRCGPLQLAIHLSALDTAIFWTLWIKRLKLSYGARSLWRIHTNYQGTDFVL